MIEPDEGVVMECPHCHQEIPGLTCTECGKEIPEDSRYCLYCGVELGLGTSEEADYSTADETGDFDLEDRVPCSDGNCIGIIINGKCNICGKRASGKKKK